MNNKLNQIKSELKVLANQIRSSKNSFKAEQRKQSKFYYEQGIDFVTKYPEVWYKPEDGKPEWFWLAEADKARYSFRLKHIAYCLLRGRKYEQIEPKVDEVHQLSKKDWEYIEGIKNEYFN